ncbi:MAG: cation diffusion facilitator family transporter [Crocinitomicaceae bacterium]|nr:cation diffusion facilitator family transporter [Crocinitomicaceae bacterium]MDG2440128.1 cation diffusion facilitator family transporter [Crocinitomicaceae bacterium]
MAHDHHHHHHGSKNIKIAFFLNLAFTILEVIGGLYLNSVAILSDAVHDLGDSLSLGTSWFLQSKSNKKADKKFSFGYKRLSLLGALINGVILVGGSIYIIYEGIIRITHPEPSHAEGMMYFAFLGVAVNGYAAWKVSTGKSMNEKVLSWHLLEDMLGWVAILIVSIVMQFTDNMYLDPILSLVMTSYILFNVFRRLNETLYLFLQGNPSEIDVVKLESDILETENVLSLHHLHSWSLDGEHHVFSVHVVIENVVSLEQLRAVQKSLDELIEDYPFDHHAIQIELEGDHCDLRDTEHSH